MVEFKVNKCPKCGKLSEIIYSNNPLVPGICEKCLKESLDASNIKQADFFCRTYNLPFHPDEWIALYEKVGDAVFKIYTKQFFETTDGNLYYSTQTKDWWYELNEEWSSCATFEQLLAKIEPIKKKFIERNTVKWGANYSFEEYVQLENLLISTLRANDISNPLQIDAIKKACKISVELDKAIMEGDSKGIKELSGAYSSFTKTAQIDTVIEAANNDVIATVADLGDFIEKSGGEFTYYDNVDRDVVDKTIKDMKKYIQDLVGDATGLTTQLEAMRASYQASVEQQATDSATSALSIQDIIDEQRAGNAEFDSELEAETLDDLVIEDEDDNF
jgi:hypothetical protein